MPRENMDEDKKITSTLTAFAYKSILRCMNILAEDVVLAFKKKNMSDEIKTSFIFNIIKEGFSRAKEEFKLPELKEE